jgi:hypothetical protein
LYSKTGIEHGVKRTFESLDLVEPLEDRAGRFEIMKANTGASEDQQGLTFAGSDRESTLGGPSRARPIHLLES